MPRSNRPKPKAHTGDDEARPAPPEQQLGDTPVPPWQMPRPEKKAAARPVRRALEAALAEIETEDDAERVIDELEGDLGAQPAEDVVDGPVESAEAAAEAVQAAAEARPGRDKPARVLGQVARAVEATRGEDREAVAEAVQEVFSPEQQGAPASWYQRQRAMLRQALLQHLAPLDVLDTQLFLVINHLPHTRFLNRIFYFITIIFNGGAMWYLMMAAAAVLRGRWDSALFRTAALPLTFATLLVEFPIKSFFRRRRPFISVVRAIVVGMKPGTWSFPSGHAASAFAGAWLLARHFPPLKPLLYVTAGLVAFSRVYLGDHYPADVVSGSIAGHFFARLFARLLGRGHRL